MSAPALIQIITVYYVERCLRRWMICTTLSDLHYTLNDLYYVERFVLRWKICTALEDLYYFELFRVRWMIYTTLNHLDCNGLLSIGFLMSARCTYSGKDCKIFYTNLWVDCFLIWKYQEEICSPVLEIGHKEMFLITLVETIINVFSRHI